MNDFTLFGGFCDYFLYSFHIVITSYQQPRKSQALHSGHLTGERVPNNRLDASNLAVSNPFLEHPLSEHVVCRRSGHQVFGPLVVTNGDDDTEASVWELKVNFHIGIVSVFLFMSTTGDSPPNFQRGGVPPPSLSTEIGWACMGIVSSQTIVDVKDISPCVLGRCRCSLSPYNQGE